MEKELNSYFELARNESLYLQSDYSRSLELNSFNRVAVSCQQVCEKYLKAILDTGFEHDEAVMKLLKSHNLRSIYNKIMTKYTLNTSGKDCKWIGDFYFDARYPGDDFVVVTKEDACECLKIVESIQKDADRVMEEIRAVRQQMKDALAQLDEVEIE